NNDTGVTRSTVSDAQGRYSVPDLGIGTYEVRGTKTGFQTAVRSGITLTVGSAPVVDLQLPVGQSSETVTVNAEVTQVETSNAALSSLVNQTQMRELPLNGRNFEQLILLAPGVSTYPAGGSSALTSVANAYSIAGTRPEGYANMLDGEDMLNWWQRNAGGDVTGTSLGIEAIAEFQTLTGTYGAQFGGNGGAINAVTKSGTNEFHGSAYEFLRNSALDARGFFDAGSPPPFRRNQFGGSVGGPIKKNKVFFFANYEGIRQVLNTTYVNFVPSAAVHQGIVSGKQYPVNPASAAMLALYPLPTSSLPGNADVGVYNYVGVQQSPENFFTGRMDYNISEKDTLFARYQIDYGTRTTFAGLGLWPTYDITHNQFLTVGERHIFSPTVVNQFYSSYSRPVTSETQPTLHDALTIFNPARQDVYVAMPNGIGPLGASFIDPFQYLQNKFTQKDDLTWIKGSHTLRMGISFRREQLYPYAYTYWNGFYIFLSLPTFLSGNPFEFTGAPNGGTNTHRAERLINVVPYFQDDWKVNSRLTVNFGLRYGWESNPIELHNNFYNAVGPPFGNSFKNVPNAYASNPSNKNFDPRVGFAWDVFGDHKTAVRGGFGIFHDVFQTYAFSSAYLTNPPYLTMNQFFPAGDPSFPTPFVGGGTPLLSNTNGTYYGINTTPYSLEYTLTVQRELPDNTLLTVGYAGTRGVHLLAFHDFNAPIPNIVNGVMSFVHPDPVVPGRLDQNPRPSPAFGSLDMTDTSSYSSYNSLQVGLQHRLSSDLVYQFSYTYSHCLDSAYTYGGLGFNNVTSANTNPYDWNADRGSCSYDLRHNISGNIVYSLPFKGNRLKEGWQLTGVQAWHTGVPFSLGEGDQANLGNNFDNPRPNYVAGCDVYANQNVHQWYNPKCFAASTYGTVGTLGRNVLVGPGYVDTDIGILKNTRITERINLQFRAELFNLFNHANFNFPSTAVFSAGSIFTNYQATPNATAGQITSIVGNARQTQFSLKLLF
ncbi:MAG TPA: carboxypeptidase regulatory-like domain-containing protein, partial [Bryobacteraceae bacterium]|nr:carboxypeptidase regulatory-like domain-containing protein [Bryobacteraceae bacterium]